MSFGLYAFFIVLVGFAVCVAWLLRLSDRIDEARANYREQIQGVRREVEALTKLCAETDKSIFNEVDNLQRTVSSMRTVANSTPPKPGAYVARSWRDAKAKINEGEPSINAA